jgi:hypothetical protein
MIRAPIPPQAYTPTGLQRALAYVATGSLPPLPHVPPIVLDGLISFAVSTAACLALGVLIGRGIVQ